MIFKIKRGYLKSSYHVEANGISMGNISKKELIDFIISELPLKKKIEELK